MNDKQNPCLTCTRVSDRVNCTYARYDCGVWADWYTKKWEAARRDAFRASVVCEEDKSAISVGGFKYSHPDHIRRFLAHKPCEKCGYEDICVEPCSSLVVWESMKKKAVR